MAYEEYDYSNEPATGDISLKDALYNILDSVKNKEHWKQIGQGIQNIAKISPNVTESLSRGGVAQAIGNTGDLRDLRNTINSYLPKSVRNFTQAAEFLANPYQTAITQTAPTTEQTLEAVPRLTDTYEGYKQHETMGEYIAPGLAYLGAKALKATKGLPIGNMIAYHGTNADIAEPLNLAKVGESTICSKCFLNIRTVILSQNSGALIGIISYTKTILATFSYNNMDLTVFVFQKESA